ncbi:MAG: thioredoxin [Desulfobacteraceae bacterium]|nr:MAG: thioredoxin [Desulfobacteraceae bacterium]
MKPGSGERREIGMLYNFYNGLMFRIFGFLICLAVCVSWYGGASAATTLRETYPRIAEGFLKKATLKKLDNGVILASKEVTIKESELNELVSKADSKIRDQVNKSLFFVLDHEATRQFLVKEAKKNQAQPSESDEDAIKRFLEGKASSVSVSDDQVKKFFDENKEALGGISFEKVEGEIRAYLSELKRQETVQEAVLGIAEGKEILLDADWVKKHYELAIDNPVEKARGSGVPSLVEFGATGCKPCDMMQPILEKLRKKYEGRLNVVFLNVSQEQILGARYGIRTIPVQAFYDKDGKEVHRHVGFYPETEVEGALSRMGVK